MPKHYCTGNQVQMAIRSSARALLRIIFAQGACAFSRQPPSNKNGSRVSALEEDLAALFGGERGLFLSPGPCCRSPLASSAERRWKCLQNLHCILTRSMGRVNLTANERCSTSSVGAPGETLPGTESASACGTPTCCMPFHDRTQKRLYVQKTLLAQTHGASAPKDHA